MPGWSIRARRRWECSPGWRRWAGFISCGCPSHATRLAELVGIGRGVDLIIYTWVGISLLVLLNLHLKLRAQMELITVLAREIAIANARAAQVKDELCVDGQRRVVGLGTTNDDLARAHRASRRT